MASGFAFIEFEDPRDAEDAVRDLDGRYVCGVRIRVEMAKNSSSRPGYRSSYPRRGPPPNVVSSRYRRSPPHSSGRRRSRYVAVLFTAGYTGYPTKVSILVGVCGDAVMY